MVSYEQLLPIATLLIITSVSFLLGVLYSNWIYDYSTLWDTSRGQAYFDLALSHYKLWGEAPSIITSVLHSVLALGFVGCFIKIFKPSEDVKYFEYGSLVVMVGATCIYLANIRTGVISAVVGDWGDVSQNTGLGVIGASISMVVFLLLGVLLLQCGLYYALFEDLKLKHEFYLNEAKEQVAKLQAESASTTATASFKSAKSSGSEAKSTKATKATKKA